MQPPIAVERITGSPFYRVVGVRARVGEQIISFFELCLARGFSVRTIRAYAYDLVVFLRYYRGRRAAIPGLKRIEAKTLVGFIVKERARHAAPRSINRRLNTIDVFYRHCFARLIPGTQSIGTGPASMRHRRFLTMDSTLGVFPIYAKSGRVLRVKAPHELVRTLEPQDVRRFLSTLRSHRDRAIVALMLVCGLRSAEALELKREDIDPLTRMLRVRGKGRKERVIPLPRAVLDLLEKYIETERPARRGLENEPAVFLVLKGRRRGMPMCLEGLRAIFRYKRKVSGVEHANPHRFRHTFGRNMAAGGMSLPALQRMLGHSDHRTTIRYINLSIQDVHADFEKAAENFRRLGDPANRDPSP